MQPSPILRAALDRRERLDHRVLADLHVHVDHRRRGSTMLTPASMCRSWIASCASRADPRQRHAVVDAEHQPLGSSTRVRRERASVGAQQVEHLRQVQLALRVVGAQPRQRLRAARAASKA